MKPKARALLFATLGFAIAVGASIFLVLSAVDHGVFDRPIMHFVSTRLGRTVRFQRLQTRLLSADPTVAITGLSVASPTWAGPSDLLRAPSVTLHVRLAPLLIGRLSPTRVTVLRPALHLVTEGPGKNNWSLRAGGSSSTKSLSSVQQLAIFGGTFELEDRAQPSRLSGSFSQDERAGTAHPFTLAVDGMFKGAPLSLRARGAALNGRRTRYRFQSEVSDGATSVRFVGSSLHPFDLANCDLGVQASGPNLADLHDLFGLLMPNSPPYRLSGRIRRDGAAVSLTGLKGTVGQSDLTGNISSDRSSGRPRISPQLHWGSLHFQDLRVMFGSAPPHQVARSQPGRAPAPKPARSPGLPDTPFQVQSLRAADVNGTIRADKIIGLDWPITNAMLRFASNKGRLVLGPASLDLLSGHAEGTLIFDASKPVPDLRVSATVLNVRLAALKGRIQKTLDGLLDGWMNIKGQGNSMRAVAADASGRVSLRLHHGVFVEAKATALSGDVVQAANLSLGDRGSRTKLQCAVAELDAANGLLQADQLAIVTGAGSARGQGFVNLASEQLALTFNGSPLRPRVLHLSAPVTITGPLAHPVVKVEMMKAIKRSGPRGVLAVLATPIAGILPRAVPTAPQPNCQTLLDGAARYVR